MNIVHNCGCNDFMKDISNNYIEWFEKNEKLKKMITPTIKAKKKLKFYGIRINIERTPNE